ncbi:MAG: DUF1963 domain-containing protein [Gemmataceae bacterium]|nr:DUF1963 domain-containing protein [Gemmataceae bacterium]
MAPLPGETGMLSAVVQDPQDDHVKLVYADWLEEKGDPRGAFLRQFVHAVQMGKKPPAGRGISAGWQEMVGLSLLRRICASQFAEYRTTIMELARPALAMTAKGCPESRIATGATKFGGLPDLPPGSVWPRCEQGPLEFLAQLDLVEFHTTLAGRALPPKGLLSFFMYHNYPEDEYGNGREEPTVDKGGLRIIHTEDTSRLTRLAAPDDLDEDLGQPKKPCQVKFVELLDLPEPDDTWSDRYGAAFPQLEMEDELDFGRLRGANHQLFGYAHVTVLVQDPIPGPDWQLLIRFSSDDNLNWGWGDGHHLFWYIKTDDLKKGRFDNTQAIDG